MAGQPAQRLSFRFPVRKAGAVAVDRSRSTEVCRVQDPRTAELPRKEQIIACSAEQCVCGNCGRETAVIGYEQSEQLDVEAANVRPLALGRKNWIHIGGEEAGPRVAAIVSIIETCRRLSIPVRDYLGAVLPGLADFPINRIGELTPGAWAARSS